MTIYIFRFRNFQNHLHDMIDWFSPFDLDVHRVIVNHQSIHLHRLPKTSPKISLFILHIRSLLHLSDQVQIDYVLNHCS